MTFSRNIFVLLFLLFKPKLSSGNEFHSYKEVLVDSASLQSWIKLNLTFVNEVICSMECSFHFDVDKSCTGFQIGNDGYCYLYLISEDNLYSDATTLSNMSQKIWSRKEFLKGTVVLVAGGYDGNNKKTFEKFSPENGCQSSLTPMPIALQRPVTVILSNTIWIYGGAIGNTVANQDCWQYNFQANNWTWKTKSNFPHVRKPGFVYQNKLYIVDDENAEYFDPERLIWGLWPELPFAAGVGSCTSLWNNKLVIVSGDAVSPLAAIFDLLAGTWKVLANVIPYNSAFSGCSLIPQNKNLIYIATYQGDLIWNLANNTITFPKNNDFISYGSGMISTSGHILLMGGIQGGLQYIYNRIAEYHLANNSWTKLNTNLTEGKCDFSSVAVPKFLFNC